MKLNLINNYLDYSKDWKPKNNDEFREFIRNATVEDLEHFNFGLWKYDDENESIVYYLYPGEWFNIIPEGFPVICINERLYSWHKDQMDDDTRAGCLAYGVIKTIEENLLKLT